MTLRDEMLRAIEENIALDMDFGGVVGLNPQGMEDTADAILDLVREALLSGPAIQAGSIAVLDDESAACWECINEANKTTRPILRAALDAVTGEGDR